MPRQVEYNGWGNPLLQKHEVNINNHGHNNVFSQSG